MKTPNFFSTLAICLAIFISSNLHAQVANNGYRPVAKKQNINVDLTITPSVKEFKAGIAAVEKAGNKIRVWVCNADQKKCTITVSTGQGRDTCGRPVLKMRITTAYLTSRRLMMVNTK